MVAQEVTKISIVTVCYNSERTIRPAIKSVLAQDYAEIEYVVVDGGSKDGTMSIVAEYSDKISRVISEPDRGIYDAMNKGWRAATGDYVGFLNSDDELASSRAVSMLAEAVKESNSDVVYGDLDLVNDVGRTVRRWRSGKFKRVKYHWGWMTPHPATYVRRSLFERYGGFREDLPIAADYELMLRFLYRHNATVTYLPEKLVSMKTGGASNANLRAVLKANLQVYRSWGLNELYTSPLIVLLKPLSKLLQLR